MLSWVFFVGPEASVVRAGVEKSVAWDRCAGWRGTAAVLAQ